MQHNLCYKLWRNTIQNGLRSMSSEIMWPNAYFSTTEPSKSLWSTQPETKRTKICHFYTLLIHFRKYFLKKRDGKWQEIVPKTYYNGPLRV